MLFSLRSISVNGGGFGYLETWIGHDSIGLQAPNQHPISMDTSQVGSVAHGACVVVGSSKCVRNGPK